MSIVKPKNIEAIYPLSPMQQGMLFHSIQAPDSSVYFEQISITLIGSLDLSALERACNQIIQRHSILRTSFVWKKLDKMLQVVHASVDLPLTVLDWRDLSPQDQKTRFDEFLLDDRRRRFNLSQAPLIRLAVIRLTEKEYKFIWSHHHLLLDGWSLPIIMKELFAYYEAYSNNQNLYLEPSRPFRDYINWLQRQNLNKAKEYWEKKLKDFSSPTPLVIDRKIENEDKKDGYPKIERKLSEKLTKDLQAFAQKNKITLNTIVQGAWAILLSRYSGEDDIIFGFTLSGRPVELAGSERMVGLFINTLPVRIDTSPDQYLIPWLKEIQKQQADIQELQYTPLFEIQKWAKIQRNVPLFRSILVFENYPVDTTLWEQKGDLKVENVKSFERANYPLTVVASPGKELYLAMAFEEKLFAAPSIKRMLDHMVVLLNDFINHPDTKLLHFSILSDQEKERSIAIWSQGEKGCIPNQCIQQRFEDIVDSIPENVALRFGSKEISYDELNKRSNQLARYLRDKGVTPETLVAISIDRSFEMIIGILGVLKAGGAYLPMDPSYPADRLKYMLEDSKASIFITTEKLGKSTSNNNIETIVLDQAWEYISANSDKNLANLSDPDNLAYVIYTSGSTGRPKGVMLKHAGLLNLIEIMRSDFKVTQHSKVLQFASFSFDASVAEIFMALLNGATLILTDHETLLSEEKLIRLLQQEQITNIVFPPSLLSILSDEAIPSLKTVVSAGESCPWSVAEKWMQSHAFWNGYGPTEVTVGTSWFKVTEKIPDTSTVPIGFPIKNSRIYLLDRYLNPVPVGVPGEIHVSSIGLARGYLNRPDITAEKFIPDPFSDEKGARLYKTGDLARYLLNGNLEFVGRTDHQVKIRGFRIELGEIQSILEKNDKIQRAVVVAREDTPGDKRLVAYFVTKDQTKIKDEEIREFLSRHLPVYTIPSSFMQLEEFPLTPNSKVDRNALPAPEHDGGIDGYIPPTTPIEELLVTVCSHILGLERISIKSNFFDIGGHSLSATRLLSRLRDVFQLELPLQAIFEAEDIAELAKRIAQVQQQDNNFETKPIKPVAREQELPLSFAQQRLWFIDKLEPNSYFYNIPSAVRLTGQLNINALKKSFREVIRRHESLRTTFTAKKGHPAQVIYPDMDFIMPLIDLSDLSEEEQTERAEELALQEAQKPFILEHGPLFRTVLIKLNNESNILLFTLHHIIADGWSIGLIVQEFAALYKAFLADESSPLPPLEIQYADFAAWQRDWLQGEVLHKQLDYWREKLKGIPNVLELPTDHPHPPRQTFNGEAIDFKLPSNSVEQIYSFCRKEGITPFMFLLAAFQTLMYRYSGQLHIVVGSPIANRTRAETERIVGFFVNTLVFRANFTDEPTFRELLKQVRRTTLDAYAHQDLPFEQLVEALQPDRDLSHSPIFQVAFVLQNAPFEEIQLPGLRISPFKVQSKTAKYDLTFYMSEKEGDLLGSLEYNTDIFETSTIKRMLNHFQNLIRNILEKYDLRVSYLQILSLHERQLILEKWNDSKANFEDNICAHEYFDRISSKNPQNIAVSLNDDSLTYLELTHKSNKLAHFLRKLGVTSESLVGVSMERSLDMVVGIMGILKAGGAFVPIDPTYPGERIEYMLKDSGISILLAQEKLSDNLPSSDLIVIRLDSQSQEIEKESSDRVENIVTPENLAYIIYTSGSTGQPKGTMLRHRGLINLANAQRKAFGINMQSRILQFSSLSFDASVWETVMALLNGATLVLAEREMLSAGQGIYEILKTQHITTVTLPPSIAAVLPENPLPELQTIVTAGEKCSGDLVEKWGKDQNFFNAYGPTETTVCASMHLCKGRYPQGPPIGRPIDNTKLYIIDCHLNPLPIGVPGELAISGVSLARGYLNRPDLTAEKFIPDPFSKEPGNRLYRTGDLVKYLPDGNIEFLGRIDHQVKVRGFRIELGEIESVLKEHAEIADAAVLARDDMPGDKRLVAYIISRNEVKASVEELKKCLRKRLPDYMIPVAYMYLEKMPLTPSGKVDRRALPIPDQSRPELAVEFVGPRNEIEKKLAEIASDLLSVDKIGIYDNFFDLGGHSLLATQFISQIRDSFHIELPLRILFERPSIGELAESVKELIENDNSINAYKIERISRSSDEIDSLVQKIEKLPEEEVQNLLAEIEKQSKE